MASLPSTVSEPKSKPTLMTLPSELRLRILEYTPLIVRPARNLDTDSLTICEGECYIRSEAQTCCGHCPSPDPNTTKTSTSNSKSKDDPSTCQCPTQHCACYAFSSALFYVCHTLSREAREICFSHNRFRFLDSPATNLAFVLHPQPRFLLHALREIEYAFYESDLEAFVEPSSEFAREFEQFVTFVAEHCNLPLLTFSIDASRAYADWVVGNVYEETLNEIRLPESLDGICKPLLKLKGVKNLWLYWPCWHDREGKAEKVVMGAEYDAYQHGKMRLQDRAPGFPRAKLIPGMAVGGMGVYDGVAGKNGEENK